MTIKTKCASRRAVLVGATAAIAGAIVPGSAARATPEAMAVAMQQVLAGRTAKPGRIKLEISPLAENGNSVPITITVESPMTAADHVTSIYLFSPENPQPDMVRFHLGPRAGRARVQTSIRLANTQRVEAIAIMKDGSVWSDAADVIVTMSACLDAG